MKKKPASKGLITRDEPKESLKKSKMKPIEKTKYRNLKAYLGEDEEDLDLLQWQ